MKKKSKKEAYLRKKKFIKNIKTISLVSFAAILVSLTIAVICFYFYTKENMGEISYPKSPLTRMMDSTYSYVADENLPIMIQCPTIPVLLNVGGTERYVTDNGVVFALGNGLYISAYETTDTAYSILSGQFVSDLYAGEEYDGVSYENAQTDVGYFNGYPSEFQSGVCQIVNTSGRVGKEIYLVSMTMDLGLNKKVMLVVSTTDDKLLYDAGVLLQSIGYTVMDTSGTNYIDTEEDNNEDFEQSEVTGVPDNGTPIATFNEEESKGTIEATAEPTPDKSWIDYEVRLSQVYEKGTFVLEYQNRANTPSDAVLYSPDGMTTFVPTYLNDGKDGTVRFMVPSPEPGIWTIKTDADAELGTFSTYCVDSDSYVPSEGAESGQETPSPESAEPAQEEPSTGE